MTEFRPKARRVAGTLAGVAVLAVLLGLSGCQKPASLKLISYKDPYFPETYSLKLDRCAYYRDASGDLHIAGYSTAPIGKAEGDVEQYLHLHLFWKPTPGKTPDNETSIDATIRYVVVVPQGTLIYKGTAYAYPKFRERDQVWTAKVESGRLRLDTTWGEPADILGDMRLAGELEAKDDAGLALDIRRNIERRSAGR